MMWLIEQTMYKGLLANFIWILVAFFFYKICMKIFVSVYSLGAQVQKSAKAFSELILYKF